MAKMLKHFVLNNKILTGIILACFLGVWYVVLELNSSDPSSLSPSEISEIRSKITVLEKQSDSLLTAGNTNPSIQRLDEALNLTEEDSAFSKEAMHLLEKKGRLQEQDNNNNEGAIQSYLTILEMGKNSPALYEVTRRLAGIYMINDYPDGVIELYKPIENNPAYKKEYVDICIFLGQAYLNKHIPDSTLYYIKGAEKNVKSTTLRENADIFLMKAGYEYYRGDSKKVMQFLESASKIQEIIKDSVGLYQSFLLQGAFNITYNDFKQSIEQTQKGISILKRMKSDHYTNFYKGYINLGSAYGGVGNFKQANDYYFKGIALKDSLELASRGKSVAYYTNNFHFQSKAREARKLNDKQELLQLSIQNKQRQQYLLIAIVVLIGALFVYGFRLYWTKERQHKLYEGVLERDRQLLHKELEIVRKKVEYDSQLISEKEDLIAELEDRLTNSVFDEKEQEGLLLVIDSMKEGLKQERENIGMDILLNKENARFYKKLNTKHPDITQTEARFCTLLYLNLDTKEIARILNISLDGVRKGRHRLRKKLDIGAGGDITKYLQNI